jgi:NTP pyrophosphatase (non-canonical NTP hydrolase)
MNETRRFDGVLQPPRNERAARRNEPLLLPSRPRSGLIKQEKAMAKKPKGTESDWLENGISTLNSELAAEAAEFSRAVKKSERDPGYRRHLAALAEFNEWEADALARLPSSVEIASPDAPRLRRDLLVAQEAYRREREKRLKALGLPPTPTSSAPTEPATATQVAERNAAEPSPCDWPPDRIYGPWRFRKNQYAYADSVPLDLGGRLLAILETLAKASTRARLLTKAEMKAENAEDDSVLPQLTELRKVLKDNHGLTWNPIPNTGRYSSSTWQLDMDGTKQPAKAANNSAKQNKGRLKARGKAR